jgi:hypothetical protein
LLIIARCRDQAPPRSAACIIGPRNLKSRNKRLQLIRQFPCKCLLTTSTRLSPLNMCSFVFLQVTYCWIHKVLLTTITLVAEITFHLNNNWKWCLGVFSGHGGNAESVKKMFISPRFDFSETLRFPHKVENAEAH